MKNKRMRLLLLCTLLSAFFFSIDSHAQKVLQIERYGRAETEKIFIGEGIEYQLTDSKDWRYAVIEDINIEQNSEILLKILFL